MKRRRKTRERSETVSAIGANGLRKSLKIKICTLCINVYCCCTLGLSLSIGFTGPGQREREVSKAQK